MFRKTSQKEVSSDAVKTTTQFGDFQLSSPPSRLTRQGEVVHLRPQAMRALKELVGHPGEVVTRDSLRQIIWPDTEYVEVVRGIKTAIREIRRALDDDPQDPRYIETVRGRGYRFVARERVQTQSLVRKSRPRWRPATRLWIAGAAVVGTLAILAIAAFLSFPEKPSLLMPQVRPTESSPDLAAIGDRLSEQLSQELTSSREVDLVHVAASSTEELSLSPRVARYSVEGHLSRGETGGGYHVCLELVDRLDSKMIWMGTYDLLDSDLGEWPKRASRELIEALASES